MHEHLNISGKDQISAASENSNLSAISGAAQASLNTPNLMRLPVQPKLSIGAVDDPLEHEADAMAAKVMRMPEPAFIQRKCAHCEEEEQAQRKPLASFIQRKEAPGSSMAPDAVSNQIQSTKGSGTPMSESTKSFMESRFGTDFSNVRIHTGSNASQLSNGLQAQAFTVGNNIYFNEGKYAPESSEGKQLLAHELTHTLQQERTIRRRPISNRPPHASMPFDTDFITDPVERMEFLRTEYEIYVWKEVLERFEAGELDDRDLQNQRLRNRLTGLKTTEINSLITKIKSHQIQRDKDVSDPAVKDPKKKIPITTAKIIEWLEVRKTISTPMPDGATVNSLLPGMIDSYSVTLNGILITVMPDTSGATGNETRPSSNFEGNFTWLKVNGKITGLKKNGTSFNPTQLEITIRTKYKDNPDHPSGYGKGTTNDDKAEKTTTLRVHEGQHGTDFISYLSSTPMPVSLTSGINGHLTPAEFTKLLNYIKEITKATCEATDQSGFSQDAFLKTPAGMASGIVSCRKP